MKRIILALLALLSFADASAQVKVNALPSGTTPTAPDYAICDQSGVTNKCTYTQVASAVSNILGLGTFATANAATPPAIGGTTPAAGSFSTINGNVLAVGADNVTTNSAAQTLTNKSIAASEVNSGTLAAAQMPALTGPVTTTAGSVATTLVPAAALAALNSQTPNNQTGTAYTFAAGDANALVTASNASAQVYTVPLNATVPYALGTVLMLEQIGVGSPALTPAGGVTINSVYGGGTFSIGQQWGFVEIQKTGTDIWQMVDTLQPVVIASGKKLTVNNSITLAGTDGITYTLPATAATIAAINIAQTYTALHTFGTNISIGGVTATGATGTGPVVFGTSPTLTTPNIGIASSTQVNQASGGRNVLVGTAADTIIAGKSTTFENANTAAGAFTLTFAAPSADGETRAICFRNSTGTITYTPTTPATAIIGPTTVAAGGCIKFVYNSTAGTPTNSAATTWYPTL